MKFSGIKLWPNAQGNILMLVSIILMAIIVIGGLVWGFSSENKEKYLDVDDMDDMDYDKMDYMKKKLMMKKLKTRPMIMDKMARPMIIPSESVELQYIPSKLTKDLPYNKVLMPTRDGRVVPVKMIVPRPMPVFKRDL